MSTLVFQIHIQQWDKSQLSEADITQRSETPCVYPIQTKPEFFILNNACVIDRHGQSNCAVNVDEANSAKTRKLKTTILKDASVVLDRFLIKQTNGQIEISYQQPNHQLKEVGVLSDGWLQASYTWRRSVEQDKQIFWLYESVTLNAVLITDDQIDVDYFLTHKPQSSMQFES